MILLSFGTRNFCFANNRGTFRKTMKTAMKGAKMLVILNSKMLPEVWHVRAQILANPSFRVAVPYPVNVSPNTALYFSQIRDEGIPFKTRYEYYPRSRHLVILKRSYRLDRVVSLRSWWLHFLHHDSQWLNKFHLLLLLLLLLEIFRFWDENDHQNKIFSY